MLTAHLAAATASSQATRITANPPVPQATELASALGALNTSHPLANTPVAVDQPINSFQTANGAIAAYSEPIASLYGYNPSQSYLQQEANILASMLYLPITASDGSPINEASDLTQAQQDLYRNIEYGTFFDIPNESPLQLFKWNPNPNPPDFYPVSWGSDQSTWTGTEHLNYALRALRVLADIANFARYILFTKQVVTSCYNAYNGLPLIEKDAFPSAWDAGIGTHVIPRLQALLQFRHMRPLISSILDATQVDAWFNTKGSSVLWSRKDQWDEAGVPVAPNKNSAEVHNAAGRPTKPQTGLELSVGFSMTKNTPRPWHTQDATTGLFNRNAGYNYADFNNIFWTAPGLMTHETCGHGFVGFEHYYTNHETVFAGLKTERDAQGLQGWDNRKVGVSGNQYYADGSNLISIMMDNAIPYWGGYWNGLASLLIAPTDFDVHGIAWSQKLGVDITYQS